MRKSTSGNTKRSTHRKDLVPAGRRRRVTTEPLETRVLMSAYTVTTLSDALMPAPGLLTLRQAVADANAHLGADTIVFSPALFSSSGLKTITLTSKLGELDLKDTSGATTISGPGASKLAISGNYAIRVFDVAAKVTATISGLTLTRGAGSVGPDGKYDGGAILNQGNLTVASSTLTENNGSPASAYKLSTHGGAIFSSGTLTIQSSTLSNNTATGNYDLAQDPAYAGAGGAIFSTGPVTLSASTVTGNSAVGSKSGGNAMGGAIYMSGVSGKLTISSSVLSNNTAVTMALNQAQKGAGTGSGGAIFSNTSATLTSSTITGNRATGAPSAYWPNGGGYGGGVWGAGSLVISGCTINANIATSGTDENMSNANNKNADGGGIYGLGSLSLTQSTVSGNSAVGGNGGGYSSVAGSVARGGGVFAAGALTVSASSITGNHVTGGVGQFSNAHPAMHSGPGGNAQGAGLWCGAASTFTNSTIANNAAVGGAGGSSQYGYPSGTTRGGDGGNASGGGIYAFGAVKVFDTTLSANTTTGGAGGAGYTGSEGNIPSGKTGTASGAGLSAGATSLLDNSIISADKAGGAFNDIAGPIQSTSANNLIGVGGGLTSGVHGNKVGVNNPMLSPLGSHGGPTQTMVPLAGSPAINAGSNSLIPPGITTDQRGLKRIINGVVDIGAVEVGASISGEVFNDVNANGKLDTSTDKGLGKWTVYLDMNNNGKLDSGDISTTTDSGGVFSFSSLAPGAYVTRVVTMPSYKPTKPAGGVLTLTLTVGQSSTGSLFGETKI